MRYTIDSSVFVAALRSDEPHHGYARSILEDLASSRIEAVQPFTVLVEVTAAIRRRTGSESLGLAVLQHLANLSRVRFTDVDEALARSAAELATRTGLRGMDAVVAQTAIRESAELLTLDEELAEKAKNLVTVRHPSNGGFKLE